MILRTEYAPFTFSPSGDKNITHRIRPVCVKEVIPIKTRANIYGQEAAGLLRLVSIYPGILETQLIRFYPGKEDKVRNLLSHLTKQGRIVRKEAGGYVPYGAAREPVNGSMVSAVWILLDFIDRTEFHSASDFPAAVIFFAEGELYEIVPVPTGQEALIAQALSRNREYAGRRIVLVDTSEQIAGISFPCISGFCTVDGSGQTTYYKKRMEECDWTEK